MGTAPPLSLFLSPSLSLLFCPHPLFKYMCSNVFMCFMYVFKPVYLTTKSFFGVDVSIKEGKQLFVSLTAD